MFSLHFSYILFGGSVIGAFKSDEICSFLVNRQDHNAYPSFESVYNLRMTNQQPLNVIAANSNL